MVNEPEAVILVQLFMVNEPVKALHIVFMIRDIYVRVVVLFDYTLFQSPGMLCGIIRFHICSLGYFNVNSLEWIFTSTLNSVVA